MKKYIVKYRYNRGQIESEMLIDAESPEEAENKAREYCIDSVVSVKEKEYRQFIVMPEKCRFYTVDAQNAEMVYRGICSDYSPETPVAIMDTATGKTVIFTRSLDNSGNLLQIRKAAII